MIENILLVYADMTGLYKLLLPYGIILHAYGSGIRTVSCQILSVTALFAF